MNYLRMKDSLLNTKSKYMIEWLQQWYFEQCDGEWEHEYGITIETVDNPGWVVTIDLSFTKISDLQIPDTLIEEDKNNWVSFSIVNKVFTGAGDTKKLYEIINVFKGIWESGAMPNYSPENPKG